MVVTLLIGCNSSDWLETLLICCKSSDWLELFWLVVTLLIGWNSSDWLELSWKESGWTRTTISSTLWQPGMQCICTFWYLQKRLLIYRNGVVSLSRLFCFPSTVSWKFLIKKCITTLSQKIYMFLLFNAKNRTLYFLEFGFKKSRHNCAINLEFTVSYVVIASCIWNLYTYAIRTYYLAIDGAPIFFLSCV